MVTAATTIWKLLNHKVFVVLFMVMAGSFFATRSDRFYGWTNPKVKAGEPVISDGAGYYAHLPQWFIYRTNNFQFLDSIGQKYRSSRFTDNVYIVGENKPPANKYYTGAAVAMAPFFAVGHIWATVAGVDTDGYTWPYLLLVNCSLIFYLLVGFAGIYRFLRRFGIAPFWILVSLTLLGLGTGIGYYIFVLTPYAHIFSFAVIAWLLVAAKSWADSNSVKAFLLFCALLGFAAIIRPTNVLVLLFIPFLFLSTRVFVARIKELLTLYKARLAAAAVVFCGFIFFQLWNVHLQSGKWALNTYSNETFAYLGNPKIREVLFGFRKGLFIYAPALLLMIPGCFYLFRQHRRMFWGFFLFFTVFTWITASWWCWWYGGGLGMRPFIDVYPLLVIPIAFLLHYSRVWLKLLVLTAGCAACYLAFTYEFQLRMNILHYEHMNRETFWHVFLKEDERYQWSIHQVYEHLPPGRPVKQERSGFTSIGKPMQYGRLYRIRELNYEDDPLGVVYSEPRDSGYFFGAKVKADIVIYSGETNPSFYIGYFKNGKLYAENRFFVGPFIPEVNELRTVEIEFYPHQRYVSFDSAVVEFAEGRGYAGIKDMELIRYSFR